MANFGIDGRYPVTAAWKKFLLTAYFGIVLIGFTAQQWGKDWYELTVIFGAIPWVIGILEAAHTVGARDGYKAALSDMALKRINFSGEPIAQDR